MKNNFEKIVIHVGLHKTATTFLQKQFFPQYAESSGFIDIRKHMRGFLKYILYSDDFEFNSDFGAQLFIEEYKKFGKNRSLLISDEQFCGSPWDNAISRKRYFDRLNCIFPSARYLIILRNQNDMIRSLYLQYIKTGGSCTWKEFFYSKEHPLEIGLKAYLNYGHYIKYMSEIVGTNRLGCYFYEDMRANPFSFLKDIASFAGFEIDETVKSLLSNNENPSISGWWVLPLIFINKFFKSYRQPFLLLPFNLRAIILKLMIFLSFSTSSKSKIIPDESVVSFCKHSKLNNEIIKELLSRDISRIGY